MSIKIAPAYFLDDTLTKFKGSLSNDKAGLRSELELLTRVFLRRGGKITVCRPAVAIGSGFSPNKHPRNRIVGAQSPLTV